MEQKKTKKTGRVIAAVLAGAAVVGLAGTALYRHTVPSGGDYIVQLGHAIGEQDFLTTEGKLVVNQKGQQIQLRGSNAGSVFVREFWMSPFAETMEVYDEITIMNALEERFGTETMLELNDVFQRSAFTEQDLDNLVQLGANVVRVPFWYRNLVDENGEFYENAFERLDWIVEQAGQRGIYVILDMHGAPGSQSGKDTTGVHSRTDEEGTSYFFFGEDAEKNQQQYYELWTKIAEHYVGNPTVAGYDLLNEPFCNYRYSSSRSASELHNLLWNIYDRAYQAVRAVDQEHIIIMEAVWDPVDLPDPEKMGWETVMYEYHQYQWSDYSNAEGLQVSAMKNKLKLIKEANYNVPSYLGEFCFFDNLDAWDEGLTAMNEAGVHWTTWNYKTIASNGNWGLYHYTTNLGKAKLQRWTEEEIRAFYERATVSEPNEALLEVVGKHTKE